MNPSTTRNINLLNIDVVPMKMAEVIDLCQQRIAQRKRLLLGVVNAAKIVNSRKDIKLRESLEKSDLVLADGQGVVWLSKLIGQPLPERVAGIDIMYKLIEKADEKGYRIFFLGATEEVCRKVVKYVETNHSNAAIAGYRNGYFSDDQQEEVAQQIRDSRADILFVAMPSPKKENFLSAWQEFMDIPVCHGVGGSFDVVAGIAKRAPKWMQNAGLEWFYRFAQEPRRLGKRYFITNSIFISLSIEAAVQARLIRPFKKLAGKKS